MSVLVVDVGTSSVRAAIVTEGGDLVHVHQEALEVSCPNPGFVQFDATDMAESSLRVARTAVAVAGVTNIDAVGITNQRGSTILWDRVTGKPVGPGVSWQDLRTVFTCLSMRTQGFRLAPNMSATKLSFLLDMADPSREHDLCFGTIDTWIAWNLSRGKVHVTDPTNAAITGLVDADVTSWDPEILAVLNIPPTVLPELCDSSGVVGYASALDGAPPIAGLAGDQQSSLVGQGCLRRGLAKATFGTGGMLDLCGDAKRPPIDVRGNAGSFPIVAWRRGGRVTYGLEAIMFSAGTCIDWLREDMGLISSAAESESIAAQCSDPGEVVFVPALFGLGTPSWDFGARGTLLGLTRGSGRPEIVRAVLEGIANTGADLLEAVEADSGMSIDSLRVDGGMTANSVFVQTLANAINKPVEVSPVLEATTLGAGFLAGLAVGIWEDEDEVASMWKPKRIIEPKRHSDRDRWRRAVEHSKQWLPELSALEF